MLDEFSAALLSPRGLIFNRVWKEPAGLPWVIDDDAGDIDGGGLLAPGRRIRKSFICYLYGSGKHSAVIGRIQKHRRQGSRQFVFRIDHGEGLLYVSM